MRLEFDAGTPVHEQLARVYDYRQPGRKHNKRPGIRANERKKAQAKRAAEKLNLKRKEFSRMVAAYFRGEIDKYPVMP